MANKTHRDLALHIDNAAAALTNVTAYIQSAELDRIIDLLEDTPEGAEERTYLPGLGGTKFTLSGFINTTTDAIFGPLISDNTSLTKTIARQIYSGRFYKGEAWISNVKYSGARDTLQTLSAEATFTGAITRTSVVGS